MLTLPAELKNKVKKVVRPMISTWTGIPENDLIPTVLYGLRLYHNGSVLHMHVDRKTTHVLSAIVELEHLFSGLGMTDDHEYWPLRIHDHSDQPHNIPNRRGQIILYESAICMHGRPVPFKGREFANIFAHFRPRN